MRRVVALPPRCRSGRSPSRPRVAPHPTSNDPRTAATDAAAWLASQVNAHGFIPSRDRSRPRRTSRVTVQAVPALAAAGVGKTQVDAMLDYLGRPRRRLRRSERRRHPGALANLDPRGPRRAVRTRPRSVRAPEPRRPPPGHPATERAVRRRRPDVRRRVPPGPLAARAARRSAIDEQRRRRVARRTSSAPTGRGRRSAPTPRSPCPAADPVNFTGPDTNSTARRDARPARAGHDQPADDRRDRARRTCATRTAAGASSSPATSRPTPTRPASCSKRCARGERPTRTGPASRSSRCRSVATPTRPTAAASRSSPARAASSCPTRYSTSQAIAAVAEVALPRDGRDDCDRRADTVRDADDHDRAGAGPARRRRRHRRPRRAAARPRSCRVHGLVDGAGRARRCTRVGSTAWRSWHARVPTAALMTRRSCCGLRCAMLVAAAAVVGRARRFPALAPERACAAGELHVAVVVDFGGLSSTTSTCVGAGSRDNGAAAARGSRVAARHARARAYSSGGLLCAIDGIPDERLRRTARRPLRVLVVLPRNRRSVVVLGRRARRLRAFTPTWSRVGAGNPRRRQPHRSRAARQRDADRDVRARAAAGSAHNGRAPPLPAPAARSARGATGARPDGRPHGGGVVAGGTTTVRPGRAEGHAADDASAGDRAREQRRRPVRQRSVDPALAATSAAARVRRRRAAGRSHRGRGPRRRARDRRCRRSRRRRGKPAA